MIEITPAVPPQASAYDWGANNPSDVVGSFTTLTTKTFTAPRLGVYSVTLTQQYSPANAYNYESANWNFGGTATRLDSGSGDDWGVDTQDGGRTAVLVTLWQMSGGQTATFAPQFRVSGTGIVSQHPHRFSMLAQWVSAATGAAIT